MYRNVHGATEPRNPDADVMFTGTSQAVHVFTASNGR